MATREITYGLPMSCIRVAGTVTETTDAVFPGRAPVRAGVATVQLHVHAFPRDRVLQIKRGWFRDLSVSLEMTDDGLLKTGSSESTGQLGTVVTGLVGAAATAAGVLTGLGPATAVVGGGAAVAGRRGFTVTDERDDSPPDPDPVDTAYAADGHGQLAQLRARYVELIGQTVGRIAEATEALLAADDDAERRRCVAALARLQALLPLLRAELEPLTEHFKLWRATKITTRTEEHQRCFSLDALRGAGMNVAGSGAPYGSDAVQAIKDAWDHLGVAVTMDPVGEPQAVPPAGVNEVVVRFPRRVQLSVYEKVDGRPVLRERKPFLVVDSACDTQVIAFRRSLWARRTVKLGVSSDGVLTKYEYGATSGGAAAASALGALPGSVAGGLEQAAKVHTQLAALRGAALDENAKRAKARLELKQSEMALSGLNATEKDHLELERLKQEADIAEKRKAIRDAAPAPPADPPTQAATDLAALKAEIAELSARIRLDRLRDQAERRGVDRTD